MPVFGSKVEDVHFGMVNCCKSIAIVVLADGAICLVLVGVRASAAAEACRSCPSINQVPLRPTRVCPLLLSFGIQLFFERNIFVSDILGCLVLVFCT